MLINIGRVRLGCDQSGEGELTEQTASPPRSWDLGFKWQVLHSFITSFKKKESFQRYVLCYCKIHKSNAHFLCNYFGFLLLIELLETHIFCPLCEMCRSDENKNYTCCLVMLWRRQFNSMRIYWVHITYSVEVIWKIQWWTGCGP